MDNEETTNVDETVEPKASPRASTLVLVGTAIGALGTAALVAFKNRRRTPAEVIVLETGEEPTTD